MSNLAVDMSLLNQPYSLINSNYNITGLSNSDIDILQDVMLSLVTLLPYASARVQKDFIAKFSTKSTNVAVGEVKLVYDNPSVLIVVLVMDPGELSNPSLSPPPAKIKNHTGATFRLTSSLVDTSLLPDVVSLSDLTFTSNLNNIVSLASVAYTPVSSEVVVNVHSLSHRVTLTPVRPNKADSFTNLHHPNHISQCGKPIVSPVELEGKELVELNDSPFTPITVRDMGCEELLLLPTLSPPLPTNNTPTSYKLTHSIHVDRVDYDSLEDNTLHVPCILVNDTLLTDNVDKNKLATLHIPSKFDDVCI